MTFNGQAAQVRTAPPHGGQSQDTRARMIEAAIEVFGAVGYDGATTRQLAERAAVNQAAIPYHFGGKRELYLAAAQAIADYMRSRIGPLIDELRDTSVDALGRIDAAVMRFFQFIAGDEEPEAWTVFFVRCERDADDAFRTLYYQSIAPFQAALIAEVAAATGRSQTDEDLKVRVAIVLGAISNFRTLRNVMLSSLGWDTFDAERKRTVEIAVRRLALAELLGIRTDDQPAGHAPPGSASGAKPSPTARPHKEAAMTKPDLTQAYLEWSKQKLDESAATISKIEEAAAKLGDASNVKAQEALAQLRTARDAFQAQVGTLQADLGASKQVTDAALAAVSAQWNEVELAFQKFLTTSGDQAGIVSEALAARAEAQRQSLQAAMQSLHSSAAAAIDQGRKDVDSALQRWTEEAEKTLGPKLNQLSAAGDETWAALKSGLGETAEVYERTWNKISQAFSKVK